MATQIPSPRLALQPTPGSLPHHGTFRLTSSKIDGRRRTITVIPSDPPADEVAEVLDALMATATGDA
jgi:hypothetical protein